MRVWFDDGVCLCVYCYLIEGWVAHKTLKCMLTDSPRPMVCLFLSQPCYLEGGRGPSLGSFWDRALQQYTCLLICGSPQPLWHLHSQQVASSAVAVMCWFCVQSVSGIAVSSEVLFGCAGPLAAASAHPHLPTLPPCWAVWCRPPASSPQGLWPAPSSLLVAATLASLLHPLSFGRTQMCTPARLD